MTFKNMCGLSGLSGHIEHYLMHVDYSLERPLHDLKKQQVVSVDSVVS